MKIKLAALSFILICLLARISAVELGSNVDTVRILSVSTVVDVENSNRTGSIAGGTRLFIKIVGHDAHVASNNSVYVGPYPCLIPDMGVNEIIITCVTTAATDSTKQSNLLVSVKVVDRSSSQCAQASYLCQFTYTDSRTPVSEEIVPRSSASANRLNWFGTWIVSNTNQIEKMKIGDQICDRFFEGLNPDTSLDGSVWDSLQCDIGAQQIGGFYTSSFTSKPGDAVKRDKLTTIRSSTLDTPYDVQVVPAITALSHSNISTEGAIITVTANGLPESTSAVTAEWNENTCTVLSTNPITKKLVCQLPSGQANPTSTTKLFVTSGGVRLQSFNTTMYNLATAIADYRLADVKSRVNNLDSDTIISTTEVFENYENEDDTISRSNKFYVFSGYFTAPRTGSYVFTSASQYKSAMFLQTSGSSSTTDVSTMTKINETTEQISLRKPYSGRFTEHKSVSDPISLTASESYYFEIFALSSSSTYLYHSTGVQIPTGNSAKYINSSGQVSKFSIDYPFTKEVISITHQDKLASKAGTFNIYFVVPANAKSKATATYWSKSSASYTKNSSCSNISGHFTTYLKDVRSTCTKKEIYDSNNALIGATWVLTFKTHRYIVPPTFNYVSSVSLAPVYKQLTAPGDNLSGTYKMLINGQYVKINGSSDIPYNTEATSIKSSISSMLKSKNFDVYRFGSFIDGVSFTFDFYGIASAVPLSGERGSLSGETGVTISIAVSQLREESENSLTYPSIESELLSQRSVAAPPSLNIKVNDIQAICTISSGCGQTVLSDSNAPSYSGFTDDASKKQVTITGFVPAAGSTINSYNDFTVVYNGNILQTISYASGTIVAQYTNLVAGTYKPIVDQIGYGAATSATVAEQTYLPIISSLSKTTIYTFGGSELTISGENFPNNSNDLSVTIGGIAVSSISSVSNTSITVITPVLSAGTSQSSQDIIVTYKSKSSAKKSILVNNTGAITITNLSSTIASPVEKTLITVTGTNFGNDASALTGYLDELDTANPASVVNQSKYRVNVVAVNSDSSIQVLLGGGAAGTYRLRIVKIGYGSNDPSTTQNSLEYNIYVTGLSRSRSSKFGGATLKIFGSNFSTTSPSDNQVLIVYSSSNSEFCVVTAATSTELQCTLPDMSSHMNASAETTDSVVYQIEVWGKLIAQAKVSPKSLALEISYESALAPQVTSLSATKALAGKSIDILGSNLPTDISTLSVFAIGYESILGTVTASSSTGSSVSVTVPFLEAQSTAYSLVLQSESGNSAPLSVTVQDSFYGFTGFSGISTGGQEISFTYSGATNAGDPVFKFNGIEAEVLSFDSSNGQVNLRLPAVSTAGSYILYYARRAAIDLKSDGTFPWNAFATKFVTTVPAWTVTAQVTASGQVISVIGTALTNLSSAYLQEINGSGKSKKYFASSITSVTSTSATIAFEDAPAGSYRIYLLNNKNAYPVFASSSFGLVNIELPSNLAASSSSIASSFAGGEEFTISGSNFNVDDIAQNAVRVCGNEATVVSATKSLLTLRSPAAFTTNSIAKYGFTASSTDKLSGYVTIADDSTSDSSVISDSGLFAYYSSPASSSSCYVGIDMGSDARVILTKFELYPRSEGKTDASAFFGKAFEGSVDGQTWTKILEIGTDFHLGKNMYLIETLISTTDVTSAIGGPFRYLRLFDQTNTSQCELVEIKIYGFKTSDLIEVTNNLNCPISVQVNSSPLKTVSTSKVLYTASATYIVKSITPNYGSILGGTAVSITLDAAVSGSVSVAIDGVDCINPVISGSSITCTTAAKGSSQSSTTTTTGSLVVRVNNSVAVNNGIRFYYGYLWSNAATWGGDFAPIDGDLVSVGAGKTLIVDVAYVGILNTVVVDNADLIFANDKNIHFEAKNIIVKMGKVIIGTKAAPVTGSVRITMHGVESDKQFPTIGNKGLSIHNGSLDIQGKERVVTWSELVSTANAGAKSIVIDIKNASKFDWAVGEEIVIASTDFSHGHAEQRTISSISKTATTVTIGFEKPLLVKHVGIEEIYNGVNIPMRAEVGLLTRNVVFEGDESSLENVYGAHIMLHGSSTSARIRHAEFRRTGQPKIIGRYPIHFHMVGDVSGSIVEGNAVHDSFARVLTIHATHYLHVRNNVGYNCAGHNIFLEDGIETNNVIEENLMIGTKQVWSMLQSDITAASFWITNPLNIVVNNRAAGGDFYGFWYEVKPHPDGPSSRNDICPQGMALGQFEGNRAHSYDRFGLRIFVLTNLKYPCREQRDDALIDPFSANESYEIKWKNFISYRNHEDGVLAEEVGNMVFEDFYLLDNRQSGFNVYLTNRTDEEVVLRNSIIVGKTIGNSATDGELNLTRGLITPRTDGFRVESVHFENFSNTMTVFKSISFGWHFKKWVTGGKLTRFSGISYKNINSSKKMFWEVWRREIYEDTDGTLTGRGNPSWVTPAAPHLSKSIKCTTTSAENLLWDDAVICSHQVVRVEFSNLEKLTEFSTTALFAQLADSNGVTAGGSNVNEYYVAKPVQIKNPTQDLAHGYAGAFLTGEITSIQWELSQIDFTHLAVSLSPYHRGNAASDTILLKFPYTDYRETWDIGYMVANNNIQMYKNATDGLADQQDATALSSILAKNCKHGDWFNDVASTSLYVCLNQNGRTKGSKNQLLDRTDINAVKCRVGCALPPGECIPDGITRKLSDASTWQDVTYNGSIPNPSDNNTDESSTLTVPCPWTILVDIDVTQFKKIIVEGTLVIDPTKDINIQAYGIWIKGGTILAEGTTAGSAYLKNLHIELLGNRQTETQFIIDDSVEVGNKVIINTGNFTLRGNPPASTATRLLVSLESGGDEITVADASGWVVGDTIAIAPTQFERTEDEVFTIIAISGNMVKLNAGATHYHYGAASVTLTETWGTFTQELDLRAQVLHLTRNIKISGDLQWGCRVLTYNWVVEYDSNGDILDENLQTHMRGILTWNGVEMSGCGQANTVRGALDFTRATADSKKLVSTVKHSAIHRCPGYCANIEESADILIDNTNFYDGRPILLRVYTVTGLTITNNHFVAARARDYAYDTTGMLYDMNAHIYFYSEQDVIADSILIAYNYLQGSEGPCLIVPHTPCEGAENVSNSAGIYGNQAQTCLIGAMFQMVSGTCQWAGRVGVSRSERGLMVNPYRNKIIVENVLATESDRSVILRFAHEGKQNVGIFRDSAIYAVAIVNDVTAYDTDAKASLCSDTYGTQNLVVTRGGEMFPLKVQPLAFDVICNPEVFDAQLYQTNVKYHRFRLNTYAALASHLAKCKNNMMMITHHAASDATAGTYNNQVTCTDCEVAAYFKFLSPASGWMGWFGGCGLFLCTAPDNVLNVDQSGSLFGKVTAAISHNSGIALPKCTKHTGWNDAYECPGNDYVQLEWRSEAADYNKRSHAPVYVKSLDGTYTNKLNMFREWAWDGNEPMNLRENIFLSTTRVNTVYSVEYNGLNPYNIYHQIQRRTTDAVGEPDVWVIFIVTYQVPMNIEITNGVDAVVDSYLVSDNVDLTAKASSVCGANIYDYKTRVIQFAINAAAACNVRARVLDTVRIHIKVSISAAEFFNETTKSSFISKIAAYLNVDYSKIKVVGAEANQGGSRVLSDGSQTTGFGLIVDIVDRPETGVTSDAASVVYAKLQAIAEKLKEGLSTNSIPGLPSNTYEVSQVSTYVGSDTEGNIYGSTSTAEAQDETAEAISDSDSTLAIVLGVVLGLIIVSVVIVGYCAYKRYNQKKQLMQLQNADGDASVEQAQKEAVKVAPPSDLLQEKQISDKVYPFQS